MQSRLMSLVESIVNVVIGFWVALGVQVLAFPWFDIEASASEHLALGAIFTAASIVRSYVLRRGFEKWRASGRGRFDTRPAMFARLCIARRRHRK
jgi:ABC-type uncharacterized transport system YnjBCD permease subunit